MFLASGCALNHYKQLRHTDSLLILLLQLLTSYSHSVLVISNIFGQDQYYAERRLKLP